MIDEFWLAMGCFVCIWIWLHLMFISAVAGTISMVITNERVNILFVWHRERGGWRNRLIVHSRRAQRHVLFPRHFREFLKISWWWKILCEEQALVFNWASNVRLYCTDTRGTLSDLLGLTSKLRLVNCYLWLGSIFSWFISLSMGGELV